MARVCWERYGGENGRGRKWEKI